MSTIKTLYFNKVYFKKKCVFNNTLKYYKD